ncbi:MAG: hydrogenase nickel incorporation protein HypB [Bacteroidales bacterium]|nr:hydrogenase nickel incorporation protein HypB [Bacteroidales bacterium]
MEIKIMKNILDRNQNKAEEVRNMLNNKKVMMVNIISSPGAGKTTLLERTCEALVPKVRIGVIEGDVTTDRDAQRLKKYEIPIVAINTEGGCHLDSHSISKALEHFDLEALDLVFVENVGNLICPSQFDLGETFKLAVVSTTEGDDKPAKYPMLFSEARAVILNKTDLIPYTNFSIDSFLADMAAINPGITILKVSAVRGEGLQSWLDWLTKQLEVFSVS